MLHQHSSYVDINQFFLKKISSSKHLTKIPFSFHFPLFWCHPFSISPATTESSQRRRLNKCRSRQWTFPEFLHLLQRSQSVKCNGKGQTLCYVFNLLHTFKHELKLQMVMVCIAEPNVWLRLQTDFIVYMWPLCNIKHPTIYFPKPVISIHQKSTGYFAVGFHFFFRTVLQYSF